MTQRDRLLREGYCQFEKVLDSSMIEALRRATEAILADYPPEEKERYRYQGSNIALHGQDPAFPRLFAWPAALAALRALGFERPKFWSGFLLSKPPHAPPLYWHQDWWAWDDPVSARAVPPQLFLMYYLSDTSPENGCLRVIPGTHRRRIPLHDRLPAAHTDATYRAAQDSPLFADPPEAVDVPVQTGDLVVGDARLLHAAHANRTDSPRTCLTLWYFPDYDELSEPVQAAIAASTARQPPLPPEMEPLLPAYRGAAEPAAWNRIPGKHLHAETGNRPKGTSP